MKYSCSRQRVLGFLVVAVSRLAHAEQLELKGSLGQQVQYNDNLTMTRVEQPVFGYIVTPVLQASSKSRVFDIGVRGQGDIRRYDQSQFDCDNTTLDLASQYRTKSSAFSLSGNYGLRCSYYLQLSDVGILTPRSQSESYRFSPSWTWDWSRSDKLHVEGGYSRSSFSRLSGIGTAGGLFNTDTYTFGVTDDHTWTRSLSTIAGFVFARGDYAALTQDIYGLQLGTNYVITPKWVISLGGGPRWIDTHNVRSDFLVKEGISFAHTANISLTYHDANQNFALGFSDSLTASGLGRTFENRSAFASYGYTVSQQISLGLRTDFTETQTPGGTTNVSQNFGASYLSTTADLTWKPARNWQLKGSYTYRWQDISQAGDVTSLRAGQTDSNLVMFFVNYDWDGIRSSSGHEQ